MPDAPHRMGDKTRTMMRGFAQKILQATGPLQPQKTQARYTLAALDDGDALRAELAEARERLAEAESLLLDFLCWGDAQYAHAVDKKHKVQREARRFLARAVLDEAPVSEEGHAYTVDVVLHAHEPYPCIICGGWRNDPRHAPVSEKETAK